MTFFKTGQLKGNWLYKKRDSSAAKKQKNDNAGSVIPINQSAVLEGRADHGNGGIAVV